VLRETNVTPGFQGRKKKYQKWKKLWAPLTPLPFTFRSEKLRNCTGYRDELTVNLKKTDYGFYEAHQRGTLQDSTQCSAFVVVQPTASQISKADSIASNKVLLKMKNTTVNIGVAIGERQQTMDLIGDTFKRMAGAVSHLHKGNFAAAAADIGIASAPRRAGKRYERGFKKDPRKAAADAWIALQYGWRPLLSDIYGLVEDIANQQASPQIYTAKARSRFVEAIAYDKPLYPTSDKKFFTRDTVSGEKVWEVSYGITYWRRPGAPQDLPRMGITNPAVVAWELVPWSFVIDWVLPIGSFLETLDATLGIEFLHGYKTVYQKSFAMYSGLKVGMNGGVDTRGFMQGSEEYVDVRRTVLKDFPSPCLPQFKNPLSPMHMYNGIALLAQQLFKK